MPGCQAPPVNAKRFQRRFPRGATLDIVRPRHPTDPEGRGSNNIKNGTSAAPGPTRPEREDGHTRGRVADIPNS
jgi:hypothetical protein